MLLNFWIDRPDKTVKTQIRLLLGFVYLSIRLLLEEESDQGLHCLLSFLHLFEAF